MKHNLRYNRKEMILHVKINQNYEINFPIQSFVFTKIDFKNSSNKHTNDYDLRHRHDKHSIIYYFALMFVNNDNDI